MLDGPPRDQYGSLLYAKGATNIIQYHTGTQIQCNMVSNCTKDATTNGQNLPNSTDCIPSDEAAQMEIPNVNTSLFVFCSDITMLWCMIGLAVNMKNEATGWIPFYNLNPTLPLLGNWWTGVVKMRTVCDLFFFSIGSIFSSCSGSLRSWGSKTFSWFHSKYVSLPPWPEGWQNSSHLFSTPARGCH